jgi:hypothetical protein
MKTQVSKKLLLAAVLLPRIYFMDVEAQKELGLDGQDLSKYELTGSTSMDLVTTTDDRSIILIADLIGDGDV